ncbi:MAG: type II toxin-antitoxin system prevent-host-death family antitoxin [Chthoniobacterales bacterium]
MPVAITISIRDLHARTGHFVRKAAEMPVIVTDNGKPVAEISGATVAAGKKTKTPTWARRPLVASYSKLLCKPIGGTDSTLMVAEERERGN